MDTLHSTLFYLFGAVAAAGALGVALLDRPDRRLLAMLAVALGTGGVLGSLSAAAAGLLVAVCLAGAFLLLPRPAAEAGTAARRGFAPQVAGILAAGAFAVLVYAAFRGAFHQSTFTGGTVGAAALGRFLVGREALALIGVLVLGLVAAGTLSLRRQVR